MDTNKVEIEVVLALSSAMQTDGQAWRREDFQMEMEMENVIRNEWKQQHEMIGVLDEM